MDINGFQFLGGAAAIGVIASFWSKIRMIISRIFSLFVVTVRLNDGALTRAFSLYCWKELINDNNPLVKC